MKNLGRVVSMMLIFVLLFSLHSQIIYAADSDDDLKALSDTIAAQLTVKEYYTEDKDTGERTAQTFVTLPTSSQLPSSSIDSGFVYDDGTGNLKYVSRLSGESEKTVKIEIVYDGKVINYQDIYDVSTGEKLMAVSDSLDGSGDYKSYVGKDLEIVVSYKNGTTYTVTKTMKDDSVKSENITKGDSLWNEIFGWIFSPVEKALRVLEEVLTGLLLAAGDEILTQVSNAVGEPVTLDGVIFGDISKVSIDFWSGSGYIVGVLKGVVTSWYNTFSAIAIVGYLAILLVIGIQITFSSTGAGRAKYQMLLVDWVVGVGLLFFFPYVMKVAVDVNTSLVSEIRAGTNSFQPTVKVTDEVESGLLKLFGANDFVKQMTGTDKPDSKYGMMYIRYHAGRQGRIPLAIVYLIMVFQLIVILFVYYKRAFMVGFLIVLFPLVAMTYTLDKLRWRRYQNASI